ncbi:hypothetical protein WJX73_000508 [Symbiochloris irregularis]|uniref:Eukaryotic translation initiation factor 5B n=1 Tax=Symbiochloris irregularis TaxID=706552 RepID=A0AAW1NTB1_9CHLO
MGKKKLKRGDPAFDDDFAEPEQPSVSAEEALTAKPPSKPGKGPKKGKKKSTALDFGSSDDDEAITSPPTAQQKAQKSPQTHAKSAKTVNFALLDEPSASDEEDEDSEAEEALQRPAKASSSAFNALATSDGDSASLDEESDADDTLIPGASVAQITVVKKHPSADKLKVCTVNTGTAHLQVVTNAGNVREDLKVAFAAPGCTLPGTGMLIEDAKIRGVKSAGMLCSAHDLGWISEEDHVLTELPASARLGQPLPVEAMEGALFGDAVAPPVTQKAGKDKKKKKKGAAAFDDSFLEEASTSAADTSNDTAEADLHQADSTAQDASTSAPDTEDAVDRDVLSQSGSKARRKAGKKKGALDVNGAFAALGLDDDEEAEAPEPPEEDAQELPAAKGKGSKGKANAAASAFAALGIESDGEGADGEPSSNHQEGTEKLQNGSSELSFGKKKKKSSKKADVSAIFAALEAEGAENGEAVPVPEAPAEDDKEKGKKKKKAGKATRTGLPDEDIDALLAELDGPQQSDGISTSATVDQNGTAAEEELPRPDANAAEPAAPASKGKKGKKGKAPKQDEEDIDALLAELGGPAPSAAPAAAAEEPAAPAPAEGAPAEAVADAGKGKKGKKKKGGKAAQGGADDDIDALLAELGDGPTAQAQAPQEDTPAAAQHKPTTADLTESAQAAAEAAEDAGLGAADGDGADDDVGGTKELSAAQKKKLKKKAKAKATKGAAGDGDEGADDAEAAPAPTTGKGAKKGAAAAKGPTAALRKIQEEVERRRLAEEAARAEEEERIRREEEEARRLEEEEKRKVEEAERRKVERKERRAEMKRQGLILTGKAKKEAERLAAFREQLLANQGGDLPAAAEGREAEGEPPAKRKVVYGRKKAAPKKAEAGADAEAAAGKDAAAAKEEEEAQRRQKEEEAARLAAEAEKARAQAEAEAAAATTTKEEEESEAEDNWEDMDLDALKAPKSAVLAAQNHLDEEEKPASDKQAAAAAKSAAASRAAKQPKASNEEAEEDEEDDSEDEESGSEEDESDSDSEDESTDSEEAKEARRQKAKEERDERLRTARLAASKDDLRSPICCILGHVDTGKTKILDNVRRSNVQEGEAGGITQQIGATYVPGDAIQKRTERLRSGKDFELKLPGLLIIDTPGHESFSNLRSRGSSLCDIAILVVDLMHSLEPQTIESINLLKMRKTPFIIALNKMDRLFDWQASADAPMRESLAAQKPNVHREFEQRLQQAVLNLNEQGLNVALYWKNTDPRKYVNIVPTSAITGEGIPDLLQVIIKLTQAMMAERLMFLAELQATVLEVKVVEGLGTTVDIVLVNGVLREGETIVLCGLQGPIVTTIRSLLTPHPLKEMRVRGMYDHPKEVKAARGIKIAAQGLEHAVAGTQMLVARKDDDLEALKEEVMEDMQDIFASVDRSGEGVCVQASTLGALEALLEFLRSDAVKIKVSGINIGPVHKRDVMRASVMLEKGRKKFACVLAFDVAVNREAQELADNLGVKVFTADIIYHLFDQFTAYLKQSKEEEQEAAKFDAVFPCVLNILPAAVFNKKDPIVVGVDVVEGIAKIGTPLCIPSQGFLDIGRIASMELNHKAVDTVRAGDSVAMKIEPTRPEEATRLYGRHFDHNDALVSRISRKSIDTLKAHFKDEMIRTDWQLVIKLKKAFQID